MKHIANLVTRMGDFLMKLSDGARKALVFGLLLILGGGAIYKLIVSIDRLNQPMPAASPDQLIQPMQQLFLQTSTNVGQYKQARQHTMKRLDSLAKQYSTKPPHRP
ncbi:hypothetical protein [Spirosoma gilvum]